MKNLSYGDKIFKLLNQCNRNCNAPDLHSFTADILNGSVFVDCRGFEVFIESTTYDKNANRHKIQWVGTTIAATNRLEKIGIDLSSLEV